MIFYYKDNIDLIKSYINTLGLQSYSYNFSVDYSEYKYICINLSTMRYKLYNQSTEDFTIASYAIKILEEKIKRKISRTEAIDLYNKGYAIHIVDNYCNTRAIDNPSLYDDECVFFHATYKEVEYLNGKVMHKIYETNELKIQQTTNNTTKENKMNIKELPSTILTELKKTYNQSGAADKAQGRLLYNNIKSSLSRTIVKVSWIDKQLAKVSTKMKLKNEAIELVTVLGVLLIAKQFKDHKAIANVRGYIVSRLYDIAIDATGMDDVLAIVSGIQTDTNKDQN